MTASPPVDLPLDPFLLEHLDDPYPVYERLRDAGPVVHLADRDLWVVARYDSVSTVLRKYRQFVSGRGSSYVRVAASGFRAPFIDNDPPAHTRIRRSVQQRFARSAIEEMRPDVREPTERLVEAAVAQGEVDVVTALTQPLPDLAIRRLTGITPPNTETITSWADSVMHMVGPDADPVHMERVLEAVGWLAEQGLAGMPAHCLGRLIMEQGGDTADLEDGEERLMTLASIWLAGIDSTNSLLANAVHAFAHFPEAWEAVRDDPTLIPNAVEEVLRWDSPFRQFFRRTVEEVEIGGVVIPADADVCAILPAANRDPARFADPDTLDIARPDARQHVAFGASIHLCIGAPVARLEAAEFLGALASRVRAFELVGTPVRNPNREIRNFTSLPVRLVTA
ncbi:cytochrome P450 [Actinomycetospora termitidis]|uniref:Cytochrome P450 n=1 Tax=Actinomycetospora termitidis TaxID=3053470 RepID=A0ABT7MG69_9PSEU|nr:cytochrome P450 [Actinomycetospora sp. Odt1-22]MDL5159664.1 cytochrome P450 [Actinomycetospora sp. Odt1-22]